MGVCALIISTRRVLQKSIATDGAPEVAPLSAALDKNTKACTLVCSSLHCHPSWAQFQVSRKRPSLRVCTDDTTAPGPTPPSPSVLCTSRRSHGVLFGCRRAHKPLPTR